jgi:ubiquinone/menaquinone biosynthesis C-methylase UbiE
MLETAQKIPKESPLLERGRQRFHRYRRNFESYAGRRPAGRLLDFGAGAGGFLLAALEAGLDARGVEVDPERQRQFRRLAPEHDARFVLYDGEMLPFEGACFDAVFSWFVFEHVQNPWMALREIARVMRPGGFVEIHADDARNGWDGHAAIPWPPYMPRRFARAYLAEFGKEDRAGFIEDYVVYITAPIIADVLATLGLEVLRAEPRAGRNALEGVHIRSEEDARQVARLNRDRMEKGLLRGPEQNLCVIARKRA